MRINLYSKENVRLVEAGLADQKFRSMVESQIGHVHNVQVDWEKNKIRIYGAKEAREMELLDFLLAVKSDMGWKTKI
jgi:hypothetical protein